MAGSIADAGVLSDMKVLDLFSGIGGFSLGLERAGMETVAFCEIEKFPQQVLRKHWPEVPIYDDIKTLTAERLKKDGIGTIDVICGGFPCQPFSVAGQRRGKEDNRDLWPEMFRLIKECRPTWVIGENVAGFVDMAFERTATDLESEEYEVQPFIIPACAVGAPHRRDRIWIVAYSNSQRCRQGGNYRQERHVQNECKRNNKEGKSERKRWEFGACKDGAVFPNSTSKRSQRQGQFKQPMHSETYCNGKTSKFEHVSIEGEWKIESPICRDDNGIPHRMDRIKSLGNAVVPQIPEIIGRAIMSIEGIS